MPTSVPPYKTFRDHPLVQVVRFKNVLHHELFTVLVLVLKTKKKFIHLPTSTCSTSTSTASQADLLNLYPRKSNRDIYEIRR